MLSLVTPLPPSTDYTTHDLGDSIIATAPTLSLADQIYYAIEASPLENPSGFDLGYSETRVYAMDFFEAVPPGQREEKIDGFVADLIEVGRSTPGGSVFVQTVLGSI